MPYQSNDQLPDAVKTALPAEAQTVWRNAFNSANEKEPDETKAAAAAWAAIKSAGWKKGEDGKWSKESSNKNEFDAEIFSVGTWNGDKYTESDLDDMVKNFQTLGDKVKPPLKLGHESAEFGKPGKFAIGWVKALKRNGNKLIATFAKVPDLVMDLVKSGRYKRVSAEIMWNYKIGGNIHNRVLAAVALLGADTPAVNNLADLEAYLAQSADSSGLFERVAQYTLETDENGIVKSYMEDKQMPDDDVKKYKEKAEAEETARKKAEAEAADYKAKYEAKEKADAEAAKKRDAEKFEAYCENLVKDGKMSPAARDILVKDLGKHSYSAEKGFSIDFATFKEFMEKNAELDKKEYAKGKKKADGKEYANVGEEVDAKAKAYATEKKVSYADATRAVLAEDEDLAERYLGQDEE